MERTNRNSRSGNPGNLGLLAALVGLLGSAPKPPEEQVLLDHQFTPISGDPESATEFRNLQERIAALTPEEVDSIVVLTLHKSVATEPCPGCGEFHEGVRLDTAILGIPVVTASMMCVSMNGLQKELDREDQQFIRDGGGLDFESLIAKAQDPATYGTMSMEQILGKAGKEEYKTMTVTEILAAFRRDTGKDPTDLIENALRHLTGQPKEGPTQIEA